MYHGLSAYNRTTKIHDLIKRAEVLPSVCACYADRPLGPIGVFCDIEHAEHVDYLVDQDAWSVAGERNHVRHFGNNIAGSDAEYHFPEKEDNLFQLYCEFSRKAEKVRRWKRYCEIAAVASPDAVWVDPDFGKVWVKKARVLARRLNLPVITVKSI